MPPVRLAILSNAGGSGKTTLSVHLAYELACRGASVALIDLDPQGSLSLFCGLSSSEPEDSTTAVLREDFDGDWPLIPCWPEKVKGVELCPGGLALTQTAHEISLHPRGAYLLADRLRDYPLPHDCIIFDCPATLGILPMLALAAATHILVPVQLQPKSIQGSSKLLEWLRLIKRQLQLHPEPEVLGFVPNQSDSKRAAQRQILESLPRTLSRINIKCFPPVRDSAEFINASAVGLPLPFYRPSHPARKDFDEVAAVVHNLIRG